MSVLTDVMDRLTDISSLRTQVTELIQQQREMRGIMLSQQRELAEVLLLLLVLRFQIHTNVSQLL